MCKIKNSAMEDLLTKIRLIEKDGMKSFKNDELSETYVKMYVYQKEFEAIQSVMKEELIKREIKDQIFPDYQKKLLLTEGNSKTVIDAQKLFHKAVSRKATKEFWAAVSISKEALKDTVLEQSIDDVSNVIKAGKKIIKVMPMTKQELKESEIK
jgi:hypothetical protein